MRRLYGVVDGIGYSSALLKQQTLLFDKLYLLNADIACLAKEDRRDEAQAEIDYLESAGVLIPVTGDQVDDAVSKAKSREMELLEAGVSKLEYWKASYITMRAQQYYQFLGDIQTRQYATILQATADIEVVPICRKELPDYLRDDSQRSEAGRKDLIKFAFENLPIPGESSSWEEILEFRNDHHDKLWSFRRFLNDVTTKRRLERDIKDDIEYTFNQYVQAMEPSKHKTINSFLEIYVLPVMELAEDILKINWSKIAKGALGVSKRHVELMEVESKAPGRECAYVFDARKKFERQ